MLGNRKDWMSYSKYFAKFAQNEWRIELQNWTLNKPSNNKYPDYPNKSRLSE